ncbi:helix-turn-helix domain-containing protein [Brevibacillus humidisoli]|uniref:ArsR/SmtB family transcription factor n=1 Tax=Brevibacillus humidisoli TaxID=2895522 RepID=UPI001E2E499E|nr:winged helix-turn-helix domain-containing protein [Brevibacillus humidisoli]UFJ40820.1 helix-turn-helix domain-containing protein [Brevibacillus humidisoli]
MSNGSNSGSNKAVPISIEQQKLLASAIRIQILHAIAEVPRTAKQVADLLRQTPGNIHYHMQRLADGGLIKLVETREVSGIVEKYYQSVGTVFHPQLVGESPDPSDPPIKSQLMLTEQQIEQLKDEMVQLLLKWERIIPQAPTDRLKEVSVGVMIREVMKGEAEQGIQRGEGDHPDRGREDTNPREGEEHR